MSPPPPAGPLAGAVSLIALHQHALVSRGCGLLTHEICTSSPTPAPATKSHLRGTPGENNHHTRSLGQATHKPTNRHQSAKTNSNDNSHKRIQQKPQQTTNKNINQKKRQSNKPSNVLKLSDRRSLFVFAFNMHLFYVAAGRGAAPPPNPPAPQKSALHLQHRTCHEITF